MLGGTSQMEAEAGLQTRPASAFAPWLPRSGGSWRRGRKPKLLQHGELIDIAPMVGDLAVF